MKNIAIDSKMKLFIIFVLTCSCILYSTSTIYANAEGIYRTGGSLNASDHAGVIKGIESGETYIYEIEGYWNEVTISTYSQFIDGKSYLGFFENPAITSSNKTSILSTSAALDADPGITYTMVDQLIHESSPGTYVDVSEISDIRCDGVVEYSHEWNLVWVWGKADPANAIGTPTHFDVSYTAYVSEHADLGHDQPWQEVSPRVQRGGAPVTSPLTWTKLR